MKKNLWITINIIIGILILFYLIKYFPNSNTDEKTAKCIGENAILYTQLGCHACKNQEKMFGENVKYLNIVDCFYEREKCNEISATPTWKINNEFYKGVQSIEKLKELTKC
jgi:hypothetical protein